MNLTRLWASTVLGAMLATAALQHFVPGINQWWLLPGGIAGAIIASEIGPRIDDAITRRVAARNSDDN